MDRLKELQNQLSVEDFHLIRLVGGVEQIDFLLNQLGWIEGEMSKSDFKGFLEKEKSNQQNLIEKQYGVKVQSHFR